MLNGTEYMEYYKKESKERLMQLPLVFSCWGLILSLLFGIGIIFSVVGIILALTLNKGGSSSKKWALSLGVLGIVLSLLFIVAVVVLCGGKFFDFSKLR